MAENDQSQTEVAVVEHMQTSRSLSLSGDLPFPKRPPSSINPPPLCPFS